MSRSSRALAVALALALFVASGPAALADAIRTPAPVSFGDPEPDRAAPAAGAPSLALPVVTAADGPLAIGGLQRKHPEREEKQSHEAGPLSAERAQILLRSLTIPGWGQATLGHNTSASVFGLAELGVWATFTAYRIQVAMRRDTYVRTARILAGIDLGGRDEEFRRIVGSFISSDEYNRLVVFRDAANLYYNDPAAYRAYIAEHELKGRDTWDWGSDDNLDRYRAQRKRTTEASQRANTMLAVAVANRLLSALHAARQARSLGPRKDSPRSWNIEVSPSDPNDATAYRLGIRARF
jgi:hypothetical protein